MDCKECQDIIITDYLDREINAEKKKLVEAHLAECSACREYMIAVSKSAVEPFKKVEIVTPPLSVWRRIKEAIESESSLFPVPRVFYIPRPVFAMATVVVLALFIGIFTKFYINSHEVARLQSQEEVEYLASLFAENSYASNGEDTGYGTAIEEYLL